MRSLAIQLESQGFIAGWFGLQSIYNRAIKEDPNSITCYHSLTISALDWMEERRTNNKHVQIQIAQPLRWEMGQGWV